MYPSYSGYRKELHLKRRPLCLLCLWVTVLMAVLYRAGLPLVPLSRGERCLEEMNGGSLFCRLYGLVTETDIKDEYSSFILEKTSLVLHSEDIFTGPVRISTAMDPVPDPGVWIRAAGELTVIEGPGNPGEFDRRSYYLSKKIRFEMKDPVIEFLPVPSEPSSGFLSGIRSRLLSRISSVFPRREAGIVTALILGDKSLLDDDTRSLWQQGGIMHMLAISGLHITILGMFIFRVVSRFAGRKAGCAVSIIIMVLYTFFTGCSVSSVRAFIMFAVRLIAGLIGRTFDSLTALAFSALLILLENPYYIAYSGFQMSFAAVLICSIFRRRGKLFISLMLSLYMLPLILANYYEMPLYGMVVNLLALPLLPALLLSSLLGTAGGLIFPSAAAFPAVFLIRILDGLLTLVNRLPFASVILGRPSFSGILFYYTLLIFWTRAYLKRRLTLRRFPLLAFLPVLVLLLAVHNPFHHLKTVFLSVGQGDSCLIMMPSGSAVLVDGGSTTVREPGTRLILPCLKSFGVRHLDYIFATHMDEDHVNGLREIISACADRKTSLTAGTLVLPYLSFMDEAYRDMVSRASSAGIRVLTVRSGDAFAFGEVTVTCLNPEPSLEKIPPDPNEQCLVLSVSYRDFDMLLTGDVTGDAEAHLERILSESERPCEVLKVAHHGSRYSTPESFLKAVTPAVSIISCGRGNWYGHPHEELMRRLKDSGTRIFRTDSQGAVLIETDGTRYKSETPYDSSSCSVYE